VSISTNPPGGLELVIEFVNTRDIDAGKDELESPRQLGAWLTDRGLIGPGAQEPSEGELRRALALREALRELMLANNGGEPAPGAAAELEQAARRGELVVRFEADGSARLAPGDAGLDGALARLLVVVVRAQGDGSWQRVKACREGSCQWAFYDGSRNRSGVWCDMAVCGNRTKVRAYRKRAPP
jgi:predicted RNA-binding Zn ribbon-like protein